MSIPSLNRTRATKTLLPPTFGSDTTNRTYSFAVLMKISIVLFAMTLNAQSFAIAYDEPTIRIICPRFDMMGMELGLIPRESAPLTSELIPFKYFDTPISQSHRKTSTIPEHRFAVLIVIATSAMPCTRPRTESLAIMIGREFLMTSRTDFGTHWMSLTPTYFATIIRFMAWRMNKFFATVLADTLGSFSSFRNRNTCTDSRTISRSFIVRPKLFSANKTISVHVFSRIVSPCVFAQTLMAFIPFWNNCATATLAEDGFHFGKIRHNITFVNNYVQVSLERWTAFTGKLPVLERTGQTLADLKIERVNI